jgi:dihydrofolate reductase
MNMIVAVNKHGIIGKNNNMIWHIPEDMKHFRRETMHNIVIMGRKTYDSLPNGPLDSRTNIVITSKPENYKANARSSTIFCDLDECDEILCKLKSNTSKRIFIIGGAQIYTHFFKRCKTIYVTMVQNDERDGVSIYPLLEEMQTNYKIVSRTQKNEKPVQAVQTSQTIDYEFIVYESPSFPDAKL